jgi:hypothetical protein
MMIKKSIFYFKEMDRAPTALMENQAEGKTAGFVFG